MARLDMDGDHVTHPTSESKSSGESQAPPPGVPLWVKISAALAVVLLVMLLVIMAFAGGEHGPGLHTGVGIDAPSVGSQ